MKARLGFIMTRMYDEMATKGSVVLIVDSEEVNRSILKHYVTELGYQAAESIDGRLALNFIRETPPDLIFLSTTMPILNAEEVLLLMNEDNLIKDIPVIVTSTADEIERVVRCIELNADDYLTMPYNPALLKARIKASLKKKIYHDIEKNFFKQMDEYSQNLEKLVQAQVKEISEGQQATIFAMAKLAEHRDPETGQHLERMADYCKILAESLSQTDKYSEIIDKKYIDSIFAAAPLHDIGKVGVPDEILNKPGKLTAEEFHEMKKHAAIGGDTLKEVVAKHPTNEFVRIGIDIAQSHHEKWDGSGYPDSLVGVKIPLAARILALGDVYDALVSERCYKAAFTHDKAKEIIIEGRNNHFDPDIVDAFLMSEEQFKEVILRYKQG